MNLYTYQLVRKQGERGFTLLELLVVIAIIGLLSSVVLASLNNAREKARDATRLAMVREMRNAMELYYSEYGQYPPARAAGGALAAGDSGELAATVAFTPNFQNYYPQVPVDPLDPLAVYLYKRQGQGYAIALVLERIGFYCNARVNTSANIFDAELGAGTPDCQ
jgi:type II secretion system protein G